MELPKTGKAHPLGRAFRHYQRERGSTYTSSIRKPPPVALNRNATAVWLPGSSGRRFATIRNCGVSAQPVLALTAPIGADLTLPAASLKRTSTPRRAQPVLPLPEKGAVGGSRPTA